MQTIEPRGDASTDTEQEPHFLLVRDTAGDWPRWKRAAVGSAIFHLVAITALLLIKSGPSEAPPPENLRVPYVVHLYVPKELTQKAPNKGQVAKLMLSTPSTPSPKVTEPTPKVKAAAPPPAPPPPPAPAPAPKPVIPTPAAPAPTPGETARLQPPAATLPPVALPKPDAPRMIVEDSLQAHPPAPKPGGSLTMPGSGVQDALRSLGNNGAANSRSSDSGETAVGAGLHLPASAARLSSLQLKTDPLGVDFQPYLLQVLTAVKLNWVAVFPTAARLGQRGIVTLEFSIGKDGAVQKIVPNGMSGAKALDNASVAAISASNPLPPLPKDFKGDRIVLQMSFMYNMPR